MNEVTLPDLGFTWNEAIDMLKSTGVDLGLNVLTAIVIFYAGRWVINIVMRGLRTVLQKQQIDKTLETFVCNLVRIVLLVFVIVAAISALGIQTTSFIAVLGAAGLAVGLARTSLRACSLCCFVRTRSETLSRQRASRAAWRRCRY